MKNFLYLLIVITFLSCQKKNKFETTPEYLSIVGKWEAIDIPEHIVLLIEKDGYIQIDRNDERGISLLTNKVTFRPQYSQVFGQIFDNLTCEGKERNQASVINFFINTNRDTLIIYTGAVNFNNGVSLSKFTRQ